MGGKILLIDNDAKNVEMLITVFSSSGHVVHHAASGTDGIRKAIKVLPDIILLEVSLPDIDGFKVLQALRHIPLTKYRTVIMLTQADERTSKIRGLQLGADDYITKPFDVEELRLRVENRLHLTHLRHELTRREKPPVPVFISYKRSDWDDFVYPLILRLKAENVPYWVDNEGIEGSDDWLDKINQALKSSERMIVCVSPDALESKYVKLEYRYAFNNDIRLYPLICRESDLPAELQMIQFYSYGDLHKLISILKKP